MSRVKPTKEAYEALQFAYDFMNDRLFGGELQGCLITLNSTGRSFGFFSPQRFSRRDGVITDLINLSPAYFATRPVEDTLSTLAHECCHQWREYEGTPPGRRAYHDKIWSTKMIEIGLQPSSTGSPGGKEVGEKMSHYIMPHGRFIKVCKELLTHTFGIVWVDRYPMSSGKDYSYAGTVAIPAKAAKPMGSVGIDVFTLDPGNDEHIAGGLEIEVPVFSPPPIESGIDVEQPAAVGERRVIGNGRNNDSSNRFKYTCGCQNIWAKPSLKSIKCEECGNRFKAVS